ncbi:uncharacterized protein N7477_002069 [Penicillium maclennaniae]|uniref:uncharacterized protein n=1 Tax=Penicillium maclennaniae TaxID=1343394 RepID=UPI00253F9791|nr:uncharacterized protein N7477_002069 [Penicillium maclennaniae]KAJ5682129.1 hypothetical protein N7477_002069 [Penicillium maclennaniae]
MGFHAARLTMAEMLKTGTTCFLDPMLTYRAGYDQIYMAVGEMGIRGCLGKLVKFTETNRQLSITNPRDRDLLAMSIPALLNAHQKHHNGHQGKIHVWAAAGTPRDSDIDIPLLAGTQTSVAHNPTSNLKLASVNVSLGTDGAPCANHYDMFQEMHLAGILHKGVNHDASLIPAEVALEMATINGAIALGLEDDIGILEVGKKGDFVVIDPYGRGGLGAAPWSDDSFDHAVSPVTTIVHGCTGRDVDMTVVNGDILVENGKLAIGGREKEMEIVRMAQVSVKALLERCNAGRNDDAKVGANLVQSWPLI